MSGIGSPPCACMAAMPPRLAAYSDARSVVTAERRQIVILSAVLPDPVTLGYLDWESVGVRSVNGVVPRDLAHLAEIADGAATAQLGCPVVPVVPVRMTEAWLLLDEAEIRRVAGRPRGRTSLGLPPRHSVAGVADPKALLREALLTASEETGRRRQRVARAFDRNRALLLERLDLTGPITTLAAWQRLLTDTAAALTQIG